METQNSYKRTVAGSVGAGVGAIFNGSGRSYYILEHKTSSKYHTAGESQKIIIDQIELGRDASCQVRFDESFETLHIERFVVLQGGYQWGNDATKRLLECRFHILFLLFDYFY